MILALSFLVSLIGLVVYLAASNPKAQELGRLAYAVGLLVGLWRVAGVAVSLMR